MKIEYIINGFFYEREGTPNKINQFIKFAESNQNIIYFKLLKKTTL